MSKNARDRRPYIKPVTRIDLSGEHFTLRWILVVLLILIAATCLVIGINSMMQTETGWTEIEVSSSEINCSQDFRLNYELGVSGVSATVENKLLSSLYSKATEDGYLIFSVHTLKDGVNNAAYLNAHLNEIVTVEEALYEALELIVRYNNRNIFMAPVNVEYNRIFSAVSDAEAERFVPARNPEIAAYVAELAGYANDPDMISLELFENNQVRLNVSDEYLAFADAEEIEYFLDFSWMTNAFVIDYMADILAENGYTNGYLSSFDGFTRNLDAGDSYSLNIFDYRDGAVHVPAVMTYDEPISIVSLRSYPMTTEEQWHYYRFENGDVVSIFTDPADGMNKCATSDLLGYSYGTGCAEILMQLIPVFIAEEFNTAALSALTDTGIYSVWSEGTRIIFNDAELVLTLADEQGSYTKGYFGK